MVVLSSLKQLFRTPVKTLFFFVLLILTTTFFMLGFGLWSSADENMRRLESTFTTIGTVEQKPTSIDPYEIWDAEMKEYINYKYPKIGKAVPLSVLDFPGANYIHKPEERPFYCAYDPGFVIVTDPLVEAAIKEGYTIVEMQPLQDFETDKPAPVRITKLLMGFPTMQDITVLFCNHYEEKTYKLYADKTYIVGLSYNSAHKDETVWYTEYTPSTPLITGEESVPWDEVTDGFYDTPKGKMWLNFIDAHNEYERHTIPVLPTNYTKLLMAFYNGDARVVDGRDISEEEYKEGDHVCLVQRRFAEKNALGVGDSLPLPLVRTEWYPSSGAFYPDGESGTSGQLSESGEPLLTPFDNDTYKIVGIYDTAGASTSANDYMLGGNAVIIPMGSVDSIDENDVRNGVPGKDRAVMQGACTSFQIPNGTIDKFMAAWEAQGVDDLEITFYDKGYSKIKAGLDQMKSMAVLMFTVGGVTTLFTIVLFCHLFITKQRKRTAIERSLGLSKALCTLSLLIGVLVIVVPAYVCGGVLSNYLTGAVTPSINAAQSAQAFDTRYSDWVNSADNDIAVSEEVFSQGSETGSLLAGACVIPLSLLIAWAAVRGNLKEEPLKLLGEKEH